VNSRMRIAFGQQAAQRRKVGNPINRMRSGQQVSRAQLQTFDDEMPKMLVKARSPDRAQGIAGLKHGSQPRS